MTSTPRILYCHCQHAQVVPNDVKQAVLRKLSDSGVAFDAVADLCELSARRDPSLQQLAANGPVKVVACFPRAVKWLFHAAKADLPQDSTEVLNMRTQTAEQIEAALFSPTLNANLPHGKPAAADAPVAATS